MKKQFKYIIGLSLVLITGISCKKEFLTPVPQTSVSDLTAFDTPERILGNVRTLYSNTKAGAFYGGRYIVYGDIRGEDFLNETGNIVTGADVWALNPTGTSTNSVINLWAQAFFTINLCNLTIEGVAAKGPTVLIATPALTNNYLGEARFIRALCYYSLLQYYARPFADGAGSRLGLPLRITPIKGPGSSDLARSTVAQVYAQILTDLNFAEANLPLTNATAELNTIRAHRNTAIALKTRVYLSMQDYPNVIVEANKIVSAGTTPPFTATTGVAHALQPNIATVYSTFNTTESILSFPMSISAGDNPTVQNQLAFYFVRNLTNPGSAEYSLNPLGIVGDLIGWPNSDARRGLLFFNAVTNKRFVNKYPNGSPFLDYPPVIRYSEVLLNLAEALARTNAATADPRGLALVNAVRRRSDASVTIASTTQAQLIAAILLERRIEFLGEGLRNNDLMRLLQTIPGKGAVPAKAPSDQGYIWPISANEMALNKLMTDN